MIEPHPEYDYCNCIDMMTHARHLKMSAAWNLKQHQEPYIKPDTDSPVTIYQCGMMADCTPEEIHGWREDLKKNYPEYIWLDPCDRSYKIQQWRSLVEDDILDISNADFLLAHYWKAGTGSAMELAYARYVERVPTVVVVPDFKHVSPWVRFHADYLVETFDHAMAIIKADS